MTEAETEELDKLLASYHNSPAKSTYPNLARLTELLRVHGCQLAMAEHGNATYAVNCCGQVVAMASKVYVPARASARMF